MDINTIIDYELKSMCYIRILLTLIKCHILSRRQSLLNLNNRGELLEKQYEILLRIESLPLPNSVKQELSLLLNKIFYGIQYLWLTDRFALSIGKTDYLQMRHWNLDGSLNQRKLVKSIMENTHLSRSVCFVLACDHYLEEEAAFYWGQMGERERNALKCSPAPTFSWIAMPRISNLVDLDSRTLMEIAVGLKGDLHDDIEALKYQLKTLQQEHKVRLVFQVAQVKRILPEVMRFCLTILDENQQKAVCAVNPCGVLRSLLTWPYHHQFISVANCLWSHLKESDFLYLLSNIVSDLERWPEPEHVQLLKDFWEASPEPLKIYVECKETHGRLLDLFDSVARMTRNSVLFPVWGNAWNNFEIMDQN